jgi:hypothetical protein
LTSGADRAPALGGFDESPSIIVSCSVHPRSVPLMIGSEYAMQKRQFCGWRESQPPFLAKLARARSAGRGILLGLPAVRLHRFKRLGRRSDRMRRRDLVTLVGSTAIAWPLAIRAQRPANVPAAGWLVFEAAEGGLDGCSMEKRLDRITE